MFRPWGSFCIHLLDLLLVDQALFCVYSEPSFLSIALPALQGRANYRPDWIHGPAVL